MKPLNAEPVLKFMIEMNSKMCYVGISFGIVALVSIGPVKGGVHVNIQNLFTSKTNS